VIRWCRDHGIGVFIPPVWLVYQDRLDAHTERRMRRVLQKVLVAKR
jgi:hypothetical protein